MASFSAVSTVQNWSVGPRYDYMITPQVSSSELAGDELSSSELSADELFSSELFVDELSSADELS